MLLIWHYQPNQRFILPLAPLLLAGFCFEMVASGRLVSQGESLIAAAAGGWRLTASPAAWSRF